MADTLNKTDVDNIGAASLGSELFNDALNSAPVLKELTNRKVIAGTTYKTLRRTANPAGGWRTVNTGVSSDASAYSLQTINLALFDQPLKIDVAVVKGVNGGVIEDILAEEASAAAESVLNGIDYAAFNVTSNGCSSFYQLADSENIFNRSASAYASMSSVDTTRAYFVKADEMEIVLGGADSLQIGDWSEQLVTVDNKEFKAKVNDISTWVAFCPKSTKTIGVLANINESEPLTDSAISEVVAGNKGKPYTHMFVSRGALKQLQDSRATALAGSNGAILNEMPTVSYGMKIVVSDNIADDQTAVNLD